MMHASKLRFLNIRIALCVLIALVALPVLAADAPAPAAQATTTAPAADPVPPPAAPAKLGAAELEKILMPIALYPDALIATMLPASVYPLEIVQAARFLQDTNNASKIDQQNWDPSVKAIAKIPAALKKMNDDLPWTIQLGEVFLAQDKDVMDTIQSLRMKAQKAGTLRTTEQQVVVVTNMVTETKVEERVVVVTNTIVQIAPANPQVVYVPSYPPTVYYPPPAYVYDPYAPLVTFGVGVAVGAIIANNCDWHHGGCWGGGYGDVDINNNINIDRGDRTVNRGDRNTSIGSGNRVNNRPAGSQKWQPDQSRVRSSGSQGSAKTMESRGWGGGQSGAGARPGNQPAGGNRPGGGGAQASTRPSTGNRPGGGAAQASTRPSTGGPSAGTRPSTPSAGAGTRPSSPSVAGRPSSSSGGNYPGGGNRAASPSTQPSRSVGSAPSAGTSDRSFGGSSGRSGGSAFGGSGGGASQRSYSNRGGASRGSGGFSGGGGGGRGGGGGGRGGGGRR